MNKPLRAGLTALALTTCGLALAQLPALRQVAAPTVVLSEVKPSSEGTAAQQAKINQIRNERGIGTVLIGMVQAQSLRTAKVGQTLNFTVAPGKTVQTRVVSSEMQGAAAVLRGEVAGKAGMPPGVATMIILQNRVTGTIHGDDGQTYSLRPLPDGGTAVVQLNYDTMPVDDAPGEAAQDLPSPKLKLRPLARPMATKPTSRIAPLTQSEVSKRLAARPELLRQVATPTEVSLVERYRIHPELLKYLLTPTIRVLVAYTPSARDLSGDMTGLINLAIAETNGSFTNSNVSARVQLAGTQLVSYNETGKSYGTIMNDFVGNGDGKMDVIHSMRNSTNADIVVLIMNQSAYCGMANAIGAVPDNAFAIVHWSCATGYYSFGHEIGHLLGARHDPATDGTNTPFSFGHGYRQTGWRTIMSYRCGDGSCNPRLQYWSSPLTTWSGSPMGSASGNDNHRVWNERAATVAAFR